MNIVARIAVLLAVGLLILGAVCLGSDLVISEIAWAGTAFSVNDEWIELRNPGEDAVDLAGWQLAFGDTLIPLGEVGESTREVRTTVLEPGAFLILERTDDSTISDITADVLYAGFLSNTGILMELRNPEGVVVDSVALGEEAGWPAGSQADGDPAYCTMERTSLGEWTSNNTIVRNGLDADENPVNGTPGQPNSTEVLAQRAPIMELTFPAEEGSILAGVEVLTWIASDPDGTDSALSIAIFVAADEGDEWVLLIENITNAGSFAWDTTAHPSGDKYRIRIRALDLEGYIGDAVSPVFEIANSST